MNTKPPVLDYERIEPEGRNRARQIRWAILVLVVLLIGITLLINPLIELWQPLGLGIWGTAVSPIAFAGVNGGQLQYSIFAGQYLGLFLLSQWLFLRPRGAFALRLADEPRPMRSAIVGAAFVAMLLSTGILAMLLDAGDWWDWFMGRQGLDFIWIWPGMAILWAVWGIAFWVYGRRMDAYTAKTRILRFLIVGTVLEMLIAVPAHIYSVRQATTKEDCYCARGSYTGLVFGLTAAFWLFGPGIFLLFLRENRRRKSLM